MEEIFVSGLDVKLFFLNKFTFLHRLTARSRNAAEACISFFLSEIEKQQTTAQNFNKTRALVVDGKTLTFILDLR